MDFKSFDEVDRLTIAEYDLLMKAVELKQVDLAYQLHAQAFLNFAVQAERKVGKNKTKPVYTKFKKFFDYGKEIKKVLNEGKTNSRFLEISKKIKERGGNSHG